MNYHFRYQKILDVKENEKKKSTKAYEESVEQFTKVANKLYESLKKKEELTKLQQEKLTKGISVHEMKHYQQFVQNLEKTIEHYQQLVIFTRNNMNEKHAILMEKHMEVKKYEKMKEKEYKRFLDQEKKAERNLMDELSMNMYSFQRN